MADEEQEKFDKEYMNLGPQFQIPNPELGPLEKRVQTTFVEGLLSGDIKPEDSDYWFTEPEGRLPTFFALHSLLHNATLLCMRACITASLAKIPSSVYMPGGWNQQDRILKKGIHAPLTYASARHEGLGRVRSICGPPGPSCKCMEK